MNYVIPKYRYTEKNNQNKNNTTWKNFSYNHLTCLRTPRLVR